jgi:hypothetical protein
LFQIENEFDNGSTRAAHMALLEDSLRKNGVVSSSMNRGFWHTKRTSRSFQLHTITRVCVGILMQLGLEPWIFGVGLMSVPAFIKYVLNLILGLDSYPGGTVCENRWSTNVVTNVSAVHIYPMLA